ncbi:hypothetical protein H6P81_013179 [Aristolochia fimbriata]|uniref:Response regulatory domain-containing protein n=1 Tax=Aristolochia fimbriata TaxID=158543 RepID=A0AAV7EF57_ARIFI|nr:hypothetical protein H6P81_013179 [Aristolochia fimbriata]
MKTRPSDTATYYYSHSTSSPCSIPPHAPHFPFLSLSLSTVTPTTKILFLPVLVSVTLSLSSFQLQSLGAVLFHNRLGFQGGVMSLGEKRLPGSGILAVALLSCIDSDWVVGSFWFAIAFLSWVVLESNWVEKMMVRIRKGRLKGKRSVLQSIEIFSEWRRTEISFTEENNASMAPGFLNHSNLFAGNRCFWLSGSLSAQPRDASSSPCNMTSGGRNIVFPAKTNTADPTVGKILLVEDTEINRILLRKLFRDLNVLFEEAENGQIAVDYFKQGKNYDLVLMDKEMPVMDGHEATRQLRLLGVKTPIIALTGNSLPSDKDMFFEAGADEFKTKPLSRDELVRLLARYGLERPVPAIRRAS